MARKKTSTSARDVIAAIVDLSYFQGISVTSQVRSYGLARPPGFEACARNDDLRSTVWVGVGIASCKFQQAIIWSVA